MLIVSVTRLCEQTDCKLSWFVWLDLCFLGELKCSCHSCVHRRASAEKCSWDVSDLGMGSDPCRAVPVLGAPSLPLRALWVPYCGEQALLALPAAVAQLGLDCRSVDVDLGFDAHKIFFPITSLLWSRKHIFFDSKYSIIPATRGKRWQQDVAEGEDDFGRSEVVHWDLVASSLFPRGLHVWNWEATGHQMGWFWSKQVKPLLLREGWVRIGAGVPWEADGCVDILDVHYKAELQWQSGQPHTAQISSCLHHFFATKMSHK